MKQPTPRKGTETYRTIRAACRRRNNPHPARGRKPLIARGGGSALTETTHTPQGDGNANHLWTVSTISETTHTPQGDGNPFGPRPAAPVLETTHTPQGDGNSCSTAQAPSQYETTHTPQGDGNIASSRDICVSRRNNPHPARGRKLLPAWQKRHEIGNNPHPARGRKHFLLRNLVHWL